MAAETYRIEIPIEAQDRTDPGVSSAQKKVSAFDKVNQKTQQRLEKMSKSKFAVALNAVDRASAVVQRVGSTLKKFTSKAWNVTMKAVDMVTAPVRGIFKLFTNPLFQIGAAIGLSVSLGDSIKTYADFEQSMANAAATAGASGDELTAMTALAKQLGADTRFSASQAADAMYYMASAGWKVADMQAGLNDVLTLSAATQTDLAATSSQVISTLNMFELEASSAGRVADVYTTAIGNSQATMEKLGYSMRYVGTLSNSLGYSFEETTAALSLLYNKGFEGEQAGTALRAGLSSLLDPSTEAVKTLAEMGLSAADVSPATNRLADILDRLKGANMDAAKSARIFGIEASNGMLALTGVGGDALRGFTETLEGSNGHALEVAEMMNDTLAASFDEFKSKVEDVQIALVERLKPYLREFLDWIGGKSGDLKDAVGEAMDFVDGKIIWLQETIADFTSSDEWADADLWGKLAIAWDKIIAEPFGEWWDGTGRQWMTEKISDIGRGLGGGITAGLLGILGIDLSGAAEDGKSLGASFVTGFQEGFDTEKITAALKDWAADHMGVMAGLGVIVGGKLLGGLARGLSTAKGLFGRGGAAGGGSIGGLSTMTTATMQVNAGVVNVYGGINAAARGAANMAGGMARGMMGGTPALSGGATLALPGAAGGAAGRAFIGTAPGGAVGAGLASVGTALGSGATTAAGAALAGGGAVLGGVAGIAALASMSTDIYRAVKSEDEKESEAYGQAAAWKGAGVAAGAAIGTAILPGIGTLIGAGIGGIAGMFAGNHEIKKYEEEVKRTEEEMRLAEEEARQLAIGQEQARYSSRTLKAAVQDLADGYITAEQFMAMKQAEITAGIERRFGNIKLSMGEIQSMAKNIAFDGIAEGMSAFTEASAQASNELAQLKGTANSLERLNWKAGLGLASADPEEYRQGVDAFLAGAGQYAESRQFEFTAATRLLLGDRADMSELDAVFANIQSEIDALGAQLTAKFEVEGELDAAGIADLQNQIMEQMRKLTDADYEAGLDLLKITFGGDKLSSESFAQLQSELEKNAQEAKDGIQKAYTTAFSGLELQLAEDMIDKRTYQGRFSELEEAYKTEMSGVDQRISDFLADEIGEKFGLSAGELTGGMQESMKLGISPASWNARQAGAFLGLDSLEDGAAAQLAAMVNRLAQGLPDLWNAPVMSGSAIHSRTDGLGVSYSGAFNAGVRGADSQSILGGPRIELAPHAWGGIMNKPHIGLVAEAGPESIIPLSPSRRERGLELWEETGALLGVTPYADGGVSGGTAAMEPLSPVTGGAAAATVVQVTIPGFPQITVNAEQQDSPERVAAIVKERLLDMVDDIGGALAEQLAPIFANMPRRGGA